MTLTGDQFLNTKTSKPLGESINEVGVIELNGEQSRRWNDPQVMFRNFRWVGGQYVPHVHAYRVAKTTSNTKDFSSDEVRLIQDHKARQDRD